MCAFWVTIFLCSVFGCKVVWWCLRNGGVYLRFWVKVIMLNCLFMFMIIWKLYWKNFGKIFKRVCLQSVWIVCWGENIVLGFLWVFVNILRFKNKVIGNRGSFGLVIWCCRSFWLFVIFVVEVWVQVFIELVRFTMLGAMMVVKFEFLG